MKQYPVIVLIHMIQAVIDKEGDLFRRPFDGIFMKGGIQVWYRIYLLDFCSPFTPL